MMVNFAAERPFSELHLIKCYLRSTMGQDRLRALDFLSTEAETAELMTSSSAITETPRCRVA